MIHLYAFTKGLRALPPRPGVGGETLEALRIQDVGAVVGTLGAPPEESTAEAVAHGLVVEALLEHGDSVLPARFGERFADERALLAAASPQLPTLRRRLEHVQGCVELAVRVVEPSDHGAAAEAGASSDGTAYMRERLQGFAHRRTLAAELQAPLLRLARDSHVAPLTAPALVHDGVYLVRRADVPRFASEVERYAAAHAHLSVVCTGPWAPYTFAAEVP